MIRLINLFVIAALVLAAAWVYEIKYSATRQAERVAKLRSEIRRERDLIAARRAEWAQLTNPDRIQILVRRHLKLRQADPAQFDSLDRLPDKPIDIVPPGTADPIGTFIQILEENTEEQEVITGSMPTPESER